MGWMFCACNSLKDVDVSKFNTENVTDMQGMFAECYSLESLDVSGFVTDNVTNMQGMFGRTILRSLDLSSFNTSNVKDMSNMFCWDEWLETIYVSDKWNTNSVENGAGMFHECIKLKGGSGTVFDANHTDAEYARIDGGTDAPGYFTDKAATGISNVKADIKGQDIYNLKGERLSAPRSGINIIGGRKVIIK
jgi:surface protein